MSGHVYAAAAVPADRAPRPRGARPLARSGRRRAVRCSALALTWVVAALVPATHVKDAVALYDFTLLSRPQRRRAGERPAAPARPAALRRSGALALVAVRARARTPARRAGGRGVMALAPLSAETLKPLLAHPHAAVGGDDIGAASWPSGHSTAALALALSRGARRARPACVPRSPRVGARVRGRRRLLAADPRLAHAQRRHRRLSGGARCGRRWRWPRCAPPSGAGPRARGRGRRAGRSRLGG